jgi:hypothetical protein
MCTKGSFYLATEDTIKSHGFLDNLTIRLIVATCVYEPNATGEVKHEVQGRRGRPFLDFIKKKTKFRICQTCQTQTNNKN